MLTFLLYIVGLSPIHGHPQDRSLSDSVVVVKKRDRLQPLQDQKRPSHAVAEDVYIWAKGLNV